VTRRTGRPKAGEEVLTGDRILTEALALVDAEGMAALTMRRLATRLGVDPMALYRHVPGKPALVAGLVQRVFSELRIPTEPGQSWQERVRAFASTYRNLARAHPNLVLQIVSDPEAATIAAIEASDELYAALEAAGLPPAAIVRAADLVVDYVNGFALAEATGATVGPDNRRDLLTDLDARPDADTPAMRLVLAALPAESLGSSFDFGLDVILTGIEVLAKRTVKE